MKTRVVLLAASIAAALGTTPAIAQDHQLVFTEDSTGLSVTYDGTAVPVPPSGGTQLWLVNLQPALPGFTFPNDISWIEPENPNLFNNVAFTSAPGPVAVASDVTLAFTNPIADETAVAIGKFADGSVIYATFDDDAAAAETRSVPDTGSTLGLLALALAGLFGASRFHSRQLA